METGYIVGAFYNDKITNSITVSGLIPDQDYYVAVHPCTNVKQYYVFGVKTYEEVLTTDSYNSNLTHSYGPPENPDVGEVYFNVDLKTVFMWNGISWMPASANDVRSGPMLPLDNVTTGTFFYNYNTAELHIKTDDGWKLATKRQSKGPMYMTEYVGTDKSYDERDNLIQTLKYQLGWPKVCVELDDTHFNIGIDNALQEFRARSDSAYYRRHMFMKILPEQQVYYLNDPATGTNRIVQVIKIFRSNRFGHISSGADALYYQPFYQQMFTGNMFDLTSYHLLYQYGETFNQLFAGDINFEWRETTRELRIFKYMKQEEYVLLECMVEKTEQEIILDRYSTRFIQNWALAECKIMLGTIRSKFGSQAGPNGGMTLNGSELIQQGNEDQRELLESLYNFERGNASDIGSWSLMMG